MNHYVYLVTNDKNERCYLGVHSCECDPELDDYYGSGKGIQAAVKLYGVESFSKTIIETFETREEAEKFEEEQLELHNAEMNPKFYNRSNKACGGRNEAAIAGSKARKWTDEERQRYSDMNSGENNPFYGQKHSEETRAKMRERHADVSGSNNPSATAVVLTDPEGKTYSFSTMQECADFFGCHRATIRRFAKGQKFPRQFRNWAITLRVGE